MSQSPSSPTSPSSPKTLDTDFANKLNPEPEYGVRNMDSEKRQNMVKKGQFYIDPRLPKGDQVLDGRGGRPKSSKKRATRRRSSKRKSRKMNKRRK